MTKMRPTIGIVFLLLTVTEQFRGIQAQQTRSEEERDAVVYFPGQSTATGIDQQVANQINRQNINNVLQFISQPSQTDIPPLSQNPFAFNNNVQQSRPPVSAGSGQQQQQQLLQPPPQQQQQVILQRPPAQLPPSRPNVPPPSTVLLQPLRPAIAENSVVARPQNPLNLNPNVPPSSPAAQPFTPTNDLISFAWRLFTANRSGPQNLIVSPILPQLMLSLLEHASVGVTRREIQQAVQSDRRHLASVIKALRSGAGATTEIEYASAIFVNTNIKLNKTFVVEATELSAGVSPIDFRFPDNAIDVINTWVSRSTRKAIPQILDTNTDTRGIEVLLANAIYFKSAWKYRFNSTERDYFYYGNHLQKPITFLHTKRHFRTGFLKMNGNAGGAHWIEVPYDGEEFSMLFIVPSIREQLLSLIAEMTPSHIQTIVNQLDSYNLQLVELKVPKFDIETRTSLLGTLRNMGITQLFSSQSDLVHLSQGERVTVNDCIHNARLTVDETGTVAAAANAFSIIPLSIGSPDPELPFVVDQPFLSIIVDKRNMYPLFVAQIFDP